MVWKKEKCKIPLTSLFRLLGECCAVRTENSWRSVAADGEGLTMKKLDETNLQLLEFDRFRVGPVTAH